MKKIEELKWGPTGLIPAVVQDAVTGEVLTVAYMSRESLAKTLELRETVFYSRSRQCLWHKGETSGNTQTVVKMTTDCDQDALVIHVNPKGPACHTGARSCFNDEVG
jgi:phosphoribosyl-AMP cyclohydrolase / phosphoribosyl-ATP pyrophosphohydrolase